ncbi:MAG TPA: SURF1 family protein [Lysobacter sp.]
MSRRRNLVVGWALAIVAISLFVHLGLWQARRAVEKQAMLDAAAQVQQARRTLPLTAANDPTRKRDYDWVAGGGEFDARGPLWLDNQQRNGRNGVREYRIFVPDGGTPLLVDLGWQPLAGNRKLPGATTLSGRYELRGLLAPQPSTGIALGDGIVRQGESWLLTRIELVAIAANTGLSTPLAPRVLRLDPALPIGHERDLELLANTLPPEKHRAYSWQWFALALAVFATATILTFRKARP